jgi:hypothetical protein
MKTTKSEQIRLFNKLSKQEQKIKIVKDAIAQIKIGTFIAKRGEYLSIDNVDVRDNEISLQSVIGTVENTCECCAKGAIFASCVMNVNKVTNKDYFFDEAFQKDKLKKWFSAKELDTIETAFELEVIYDSSDYLSNEYGDYNNRALEAITFGKKYNNQEKRLLAILKNIVKYGKFTPVKPK